MALIDRLDDLLGDEVLLDEDSRRSRARDTWPRSELDQWQGRMQLPAAVAMPSTAERVAETVRRCQAQRVPMIPRGAGSG